MQKVDLALCLSVDVSASIDYDEFGLMIGGYATAFRDGEIRAACLAGPEKGVAVAMVFWSSPGEREVVLPWHRIGSEEEAERVASAIQNAPRLPSPGSTALGDGMLAGLALLGNCPAEATRLVMDVSGDGKHNIGRLPGPVRDLAVSGGITINAIAVLNEEPDLVEHYQTEVIGGPGCFVMSCADYADFVEAIRRKLLREIQGDPLIV
ncbi:DUF1194 domain-containing protein [Acetobacteraceae bacterium H6797]|nr:DUF1194 domain-containing protein [Acetobacteraceae bacterium H6797]